MEELASKRIVIEEGDLPDEIPEKGLLKVKNETD
jgi:hypothetical protein